MRVLVGLLLVALFALAGAPATAETEDEQDQAVAGAVVRALVGFPFVNLPLELSALEILIAEDPPAPDMTGGCDPVITIHGHPAGCGSPLEDPAPAEGGGGGGNGGAE